MNTAWSHLPNAVHIDRIIADVKTNSEAWNSAWDAARDAAWVAAWVAARNSARNSARDAVWDAAWDAVWDAVWEAAWVAIAALIAWDDSSNYLSLSADKCKVLAILGDKKAVLMLPAVIVFEKSKETA